MNTLKPLYEVPVTSTNFTTEAYLCDDTIRYAYYKDGRSVRSGIRFHHIPATRTRAERCCKSWHIKAYDTLVEVEASPWVAEIYADTTDARSRDYWEMHHYMIYLDSVGCFEIIAESYEILPEQPDTEPYEIR